MGVGRRARVFRPYQINFLLFQSEDDGRPSVVNEVSDMQLFFLLPIRAEHLPLTLAAIVYTVACVLTLYN